jgi:predicted DNA-binding ribbon-helix-helix protein
MKSLVVKRSVVLANHKTSVSLEDAFWNSLKEIAGSGNMSLSDLITAIDTARHTGIYRRLYVCLCSTFIGNSSLTDSISAISAKQFRG